MGHSSCCTLRLRRHGPQQVPSMPTNHRRMPAARRAARIGLFVVLSHGRCGAFHPVAYRDLQVASCCRAPVCQSEMSCASCNPSRHANSAAGRECVEHARWANRVRSAEITSNPSEVQPRRYVGLGSCCQHRCQVYCRLPMARAGGPTCCSARAPWFCRSSPWAVGPMFCRPPRPKALSPTTANASDRAATAKPASSLR